MLQNGDVATTKTVFQKSKWYFFQVFVSTIGFFSTTSIWYLSQHSAILVHLEPKNFVAPLAKFNSRWNDFGIGTAINPNTLWVPIIGSVCSFYARGVSLVKDTSASGYERFDWTRGLGQEHRKDKFDRFWGRDLHTSDVHALDRKQSRKKELPFARAFFCPRPP